MALNELQHYTPRMPKSLDFSRVRLTYNPKSDTLLLHLAGAPRPAVSVPVRGGWYVRVDPETEEVVGFQVDAYLARAVYEFPPLLDLAPAVGIDDATVARVRRDIEPEKTTRAVVATLLGHVFGFAGGTSAPAT